MAESVSLKNDAVLRASQIWIFADKVAGGSLDVSGIDGTTENRDGSDAGSVYVLARRIDRVNMKAVGGNGFPGGPGSRGRNGRNGSCAGFGGWRPAQRGGNGGQGEPGGKAGDVRIVFGISDTPQNVNRSPGNEGEEGKRLSKAAPSEEVTP